MLAKNVETDRPVAVDVGVVDLCLEAHFGGFERVIGRESDHQEEYTAGVWAIAGPHDGCLPLEHVSFALRPRRARRGRVSAEVMEFFGDAFEGHGGE